MKTTAGSNRVLGLSIAAALALVACGGDDTSSTPTTSSASATSSSSADASSSSSAASGGGGAGTGGAAASSGAGGAGGSAPFTLTSTAYSEGEMIPQKYVCNQGGGMNVSPPLAWGDGPPGTKSYAIVMRDLDFGPGFEHWALWDIPADVHALPENVQHVFQPAVPAGSKQAGTGYLGPCSPNSVNTYEIRVFAIDVATIPGLDMNSSKAEAATAIEMAPLASAALSGES